MVIVCSPCTYYALVPGFGDINQFSKSRAVLLCPLQKGVFLQTPSETMKL